MDSRLVPKNLNDLIIHKTIARRLLNFDFNNISNIIFYGRQNNGKYLLSKLLINYLNSCNIFIQTSINTHDLKIGNNTVNIDFFSSPYHIEINLVEYGLYDKYIISDFLQEYLNYKNISGRTKIVILKNIDKISKQAQNCLRGLVEKNSEIALFICLSTSLSNIESTLKSRFLNIRVPVPTNSEFNEYFDFVSNNILKLTKTKRKILIEKKSLYEINYTISLFINHKKNLELIDHTCIFKKIINKIEEPDILSILKIRELCYNLLLINISMPKLLKHLVNHYINNKTISDNDKILIIDFASTIDSKMCNLEHDIICIEFFILKVKKLLIK